MFSFQTVVTKSTWSFFQAVIGVAFSIGFVFGPLIGAIFSVWARERQGEFYIYPALFALVLAILDVIYVAMVFEETLPKHRRVNFVFNLYCENYTYKQNSDISTIVVNIWMVFFAKATCIVLVYIKTYSLA